MVKVYHWRRDNTGSNHTIHFEMDEVWLYHYFLIAIACLLKYQAEIPLFPDLIYASVTCHS